MVAAEDNKSCGKVTRINFRKLLTHCFQAEATLD